MFLLEALHNIVTRLERHLMLTFTKETTFEVARVIGDVVSAVIRVGWLDQLNRKVYVE